MRFTLLALVASSLQAVAATSPRDVHDARLRTVTYDPQAVVTVPVKRGVVTLIALDVDETITDVAAGLGGDCTKTESAWCIAAQPGGHNVFVKPKSLANAPNNLVVVTDRRTHAFKFVVLADADPHPPVFRLQVSAPARRVPAAQAVTPRLPLLPPLEVAPLPRPEELVSKRLQAKPQVMNTQYSMAQGRASDDIVPTLVFDDGRFTYLRFPGNRELPAVFHVRGDGGETLVNARMEDDILVVGRVSRRLMLRAGNAVVGLWNDAFDPDGVPPDEGATVPGIQRALRPSSAPTAEASRGVAP